MQHSRVLTSGFAGDLEPLLQGSERGHEVYVGHGLYGAQETVDYQEAFACVESLDPAGPPGAQTTQSTHVPLHGPVHTQAHTVSSAFQICRGLHRSKVFRNVDERMRYCSSHR